MSDLPPLFAPGQRLGRYELLQRLAVGGMAEVYLAYAKGPGDFRKVVAIKRLLPQHALDPQLLRMFLDEARLMARLSHPNVAQVADVGDGDGVDVPYFVMEYIHGTDLRGVLNAANGPLPMEHALAIASAVAAGLHHAHELRGAGGQPLEIVHRDVSPSNVLISFDGAVKVTDFGVAKWTEQKSFTHQGQLKGKFAHMSPEQCRGEPLDRRSDVFALGTLLYEMTTGNQPFVAESEFELLTRIVSGDVPAPTLPGKEYPPDLAAIVMRSLRRSRDERHVSTQELQLDLEAFAREHRLVVSSVALAGYLESLFGARVTEWREAQASGKTLADHLTDRRPANASGNTGAKDRTATDAFTVRSAVTKTERTRVNLKPVDDGMPIRPAVRMTRTLVVLGASALALALLLVTTELTSRWQRGPDSNLAPVRAVGAPGSEPPVVAGVASPPSPSRSTGARPARPIAPVALGPESTPTTIAPTVPTVTPGETLGRRGRDSAGAAHPARRRSLTVPPPSMPSPFAAASANAGASTAPIAAPDPAGVPPPQSRPEPQHPATPTPTPVKVWDPDSPVPP